MDSALEKSENKNRSATFGSSESTSPILVSKMANRRRKKCLNKYKSPENGGFCKKKLKIFEENDIHFLSAPVCGRYSTNGNYVRRNLNKLFSNMKEHRLVMKAKTESVSEHLPQHENMCSQSQEMFNSVCGINSYQNYENKEERCEKIEKLRNLENEICKSDLSGEPTSPVCSKQKDNAFTDVTENSLFQESQKQTVQHSPLMEFESPVRCSVKSNSDNRSPLWFHEFDSDSGNNENNLAEVCTPASKVYIQNDNITNTPTGKIKEYNTQNLTEQNRFQRNLSPVFIDFETSPVVSKPDSFKISLLKSKDVMNEDLLKRTRNIPDLFCADRNIHKEPFTTCFETKSHSLKLREPIIIEECTSPPVRKQGSPKLSVLNFNLGNEINKDASLVDISTTKRYEQIEDCSQESYLGGSPTSPQCRNKNDYNKVCGIIEYEQSQCQSRISSSDDTNISLYLSPGLNKNTQVCSSAKDTANQQSIKLSEQLGQASTLLDSPSSKRRRKAKPGSLILRLNQLVRRSRSETNVWKHENKYVGVPKKSKGSVHVLRIVSMWKESTRIILQCCRDVIVDSRKRETCNEESYMDFKIIIILETPDAQNLVEGSCVRIFPPWQILELENKRTLVFLCVSKLELLSNSMLLCKKKKLKQMTEKKVVRDFSSNISQICLNQERCSVFSEVKTLYFPVIFGQSILSKTAAVKRYYSSQVHTIKSSVINSVIFSEIHARGHVVYEFRCRNGSDGGGTITNILVEDDENEVFQIMLKTESDEHKWQLEKTKHSNIQNICFLFSGLVVVTQLEVHRTPGLASLLTHLNQTSNTQGNLYVLSPSCDWWNLKPCGKSDRTFLSNKIDSNGLLQLCCQTEEMRQTAVVTVLLFTGKKIYFQGNRSKPYGIISVDDLTVVPKIKCGYIIEIFCLKCVSGHFTVDRYSVVTIQENWAKHISFYVALLPCFTMQSQAEDLVTIKGTIKEIHEEYCSCDKKWIDSLSGRCQALCKTISEKNKTIVAFIKVSELPSECIVKVKGLNKTLCSGSAVSLVCLVINVLRNELGNVNGFIVQNL